RGCGAAGGRGYRAGRRRVVDQRRRRPSALVRSRLPGDPSAVAGPEPNPRTCVETISGRRRDRGSGVDGDPLRQSGVNEPEKGRHWGRISVVVVILALTLMWIYALFVVSPDATSDKLSSSAFPQAAEPVCASTLTELQRLGVVNQKAASPQ